jgi:hypothetical protein
MKPQRNCSPAGLSGKNGGQSGRNTGKGGRNVTKKAVEGEDGDEGTDIDY